MPIVLRFLILQLRFLKLQARVFLVEYGYVHMNDETIPRLRSDRRTTIQVSISDKAEFNRLKPEGMSDWLFFRKLLALGMAEYGEDASKSGGLAA